MPPPSGLSDSKTTSSAERMTMIANSVCLINFIGLVRAWTGAPGFNAPTHAVFNRVTSNAISGPIRLLSWISYASRFEQRPPCTSSSAFDVARHDSARLKPATRSRNSVDRTCVMSRYVSHRTNRSRVSNRFTIASKGRLGLIQRGPIILLLFARSMSRPLAHFSLKGAGA
jgi:hypothetical protein